MMSVDLTERNKEFLTIVINECIQQIRAKSLYATSNEVDSIRQAFENIKHFREIAKKLDLKDITPKLS